MSSSVCFSFLRVPELNTIIERFGVSLNFSNICVPCLTPIESASLCLFVGPDLRPEAFTEPFKIVQLKSSYNDIKWALNVSWNFLFQIWHLLFSWDRYKCLSKWQSVLQMVWSFFIDKGNRGNALIEKLFYLFDICSCYG